MIEAIKLAQTFCRAPAWKGYIAEEISSPVNATNDQLQDYIRGSVVTSYHAIGLAAMFASGARYGVVDSDLSVKGAS
ncbi:hypothetical protein CVT25_014742 [Psilocybe cyanescens]|uniref:Glucose-methanol-choline oxidoreductase C-terminal domain-containing protein n=1 Tax=Psilocybe cyanescens TaxID=93625 RepID=A0A409XJZ2_PSICY|nr:hypothetical protein CVT25_014742 [Psilocybe cyanescens]